MSPLPFVPARDERQKGELDMARQLARALVFVLLCTLPIAGQTFAELLQKAIYTQDTLGDVDGAVRIYQQIISGAPPSSEVRRQAQRRLQALEARRHKGLPILPPVPLGTYDGRIYRHTRTRVTFEVPPLWKVHGTGPSSDNGEMVVMGAVDPSANVHVWLIPEKNDWEGIEKKLNASPVMKEQNRQAGNSSYRLRDGSVQRLVIGGNHAITAIGDYRDNTGAMAEYMTWIYTENTHTFFFANVKADELDRLRPQVDALLYSAHIP